MGKPSKEPVNVVGYVRVSTAEQAKDGVSLRLQEDRVRGYCDLYGLTLAETIRDEGASAKDLDRPGLKRALEMLRAGSAHGIVVAKLDRLTRSIRDLGELLEHYFGEKPGKMLFSVGDQIDTRSAAGRLVLNVLMSVSQWEREIIVERTQGIMDDKRARGERLGTIPYGHELDPDGPRNANGQPIKLRVAPMEARAIDEILALHEMGRSLEDIAGYLNANGYPTRRGGSWCKQTIAAILRREAARRSA